MIAPIRGIDAFGEALNQTYGEPYFRSFKSGSALRPRSQSIRGDEPLSGNEEVLSLAEILKGVDVPKVVDAVEVPLLTSTEQMNGWLA